MRRRTRLVLTLRHYFGLNSDCPHPQHRIVERSRGRFRCLECWLSWRPASIDDHAESWWGA